ncbi:MAG: PAS-domain containing protein [Luminiphilus sp.]|nr:PAS-domain containing protein [Luminiphilus sp.]
MTTASTPSKDQFLTSLVTTAYWLVFGAHFLIFVVMVARSSMNDEYTLPAVTWAVWSVIIVGTPIALLSNIGRGYQFRAWLTQALLTISLLFGLVNQGLSAVTLFNIPFIALIGAIFFSFRLAVMQTFVAVMILVGFLIAKLTGFVEDTPNADWVLNSDYRWILRTTYVSLFSGVFIYFLHRYIAFTFITVEDLGVLQEAVDEAPDAFVVWNSEDELFMSNRRYQDLDQRLKPYLKRGVSFEETLRVGIQTGMYPDAVGCEEEWVAERLEAHNQSESSRLVKLDDGRWMNVVESRTSSGYLAGFRTDVTALRNSEDLLQATLDSVSEAVVTLSGDGHVLNLNAASQAIFGYDLEELRGRHVTQIAPDESTTVLRKTLVSKSQSTALGQVRQKLDILLQRKSGEAFRARIDVRDVEINGERVYLNFITDLSRQRNFEGTIEALGAAIEQLSAGVVLLDAQEQVIYSNHHFSQLLGLAAPNELLGLTVGDFFKIVAEATPGLMVSNDTSPVTGLIRFFNDADGPVTLQTPGGSRLQMRRQALEGSNSILTLIDTTEEFELQMQLEQSTKLATLGEMAAGIAHELNQPLNAIKLTAATLSRVIEKNPRKAVAAIAGKLIQISSQVDRAATITDHMRQSARLASEKEAVADLPTVVASAHLMVESGLRLESIEYRVALPETLLPCNIHPVRLEQVLLNLFSNARDAFVEREVDKAERWISVSAHEKSNSAIVLEIEDSAGGIPDAVISRVFDPFYTTKEVGKGTGLGLSISYGILNDAGGSLSVKNTAHGAKFTIVLPT